MPEESKEVKPETDQKISQETLQTVGLSTTEEGATVSSDDENPDSLAADAPATSSTTKKKKRKKNKKTTSNAKQDGQDTATESPESSKKAEKKLSGPVIDQLLQDNPALANEVSGMSRQKLEEVLKKVDVSELLTGLVCYNNARLYETTIIDRLVRDRLLAGRIKKIWHHISSGRHSRFQDSVRHCLVDPLRGQTMLNGRESQMRRRRVKKGLSRLSIQKRFPRSQHL